MLIHLASNLELLEGYFIRLFWQTYHTSLYAVLDEASFKSHYQSLYVNVPAGNSRRPSALVDIVIAMCMQYGTSKLPRGEQGNIVQDNDATMAGRWYYRRAQALLACEVESPSISTLQCHLLCAIYVCAGSFHNMADSISGLAVRTAYMLGLHLDHPQTMPEPERQLRRRLWWSVFELDTKVGMKLGRPFLLQDSHVMPGLPSDTLDAAILSGSSFTPITNDTTWLSFSLHRVKLYRTARNIHSAIYSHDLALVDGKTVYEDPNRLEDLAKAIYPYTKYIDDWVKEIPSALETSRKEQGNAFSTDGSLLDIEQYAPLWLQRQCLLLELEYCHLSVNLNRPFISFASQQVPGRQGFEMAGRCASHAIEFSNITHQLAVSALDTFGASFEAAAKAAVIVRTLSINIDSFMDGPAVTESSLERVDHSAISNYASTGILPSANGMAGGSEMSYSVSTEPPELDLFDMALGVDFWAGIDVLWPGVSLNPEEAS
ncbi:hypothetical protein FALCPG4_018226 [Fusarium falciforme]